MPVAKPDVLKLYKSLLKYSKTLNFSDPVYFRHRISEEFHSKKTLTNAEDIEFAYKDKLYSGKDQLYKMFKFNLALVVRSTTSFLAVAHKHTLDYSRVPKLIDGDLEEKFVRGSGPGGSAVNKNANCVVLTHKPTGTVIKCHSSRCQDENRKMAQKLLVAKLDLILNGEDSIAAQKKRIDDNKIKKNEYKKKKLAQLKNEWKKREGLV